VTAASAELQKKLQLVQRLSTARQTSGRVCRPWGFPKSISRKTEAERGEKRL